MIFNLSNDFLMLDFDPSSSLWSVHSTAKTVLGFTGASFGISLRDGSEELEWNGTLDQPSTRRTEGVDHRHGAWQGLRVDGLTPTLPLSVTVDFRLMQNSGLLLWQMHLQNLGHRPINLKRIDLLHVGDVTQHRLKRWFSISRRSETKGTISLGGLPLDTWFMNGWQSWSFAGTLRDEDLVTGTRLGPLTRPMYLNPTSQAPDGKLERASELFAILGNQTSGQGILVGQLSEKKSFCSIQASIEHNSPSIRLTNGLEGIPLNPGQIFISDWAALQMVDLHKNEPHRQYLEAVARENDVRDSPKAPVGWCSWYYYFDHVKETDVIRNLKWISERQSALPIDLILLDDGYQSEIGDWLELGDGFPEGHQTLVRRIKGAGFKAGLWLAPFIAKPSASIIANHPDWVLRNSNGRPVRAGYNWGAFFIALDLTHPEVIDYLQRIVNTAVHIWGYEYLKLDFLYAAALPGVRWDPQQTGAQVLRRGLEVIRRAAGENVFLAGCGCPLGPAVGLVDSMRIGPDVAARWLPAFQGIEFYVRKEPSLPSLRNSIQNSLARVDLHNRWWLNDPDCVLLRSTDTHLSADEVKLMATVAALSGGSLMFSDDFPRLDEERVQWAARLLPALGTKARVPDLFEKHRPETMVAQLDGVLGEWILLALINWSSNRRRLNFDAGNEMGWRGGATGVDFWQGEPVSLEGDRWNIGVPGRGVRLLQLRRKSVGMPSWLGDNLHISGGKIVKGWQASKAELEADLELGRKGSGKVWLRLPADPVDIRFINTELAWEIVGDHITMIRLPAFEKGTLHVRWQ